MSGTTDDTAPPQDPSPPLHEHMQRLAESLFVARLRARDLEAQLGEAQRHHLAAQRAAGVLPNNDAEG